MVGVEWQLVLLIGCVVAVGATVQSMIGIGLGIVGAPLLALLEPSLVPSLLILLAIPVSTTTMVLEWRHISWHAVAWSLPARLPGIAVGAWLVSRFDDRQLGVAVAVMVLVAVALAARTYDVPHGAPTLTLAGFASGVAGTGTGIGGPPMAVALAGRPPREARATLSFFFTVGGVLSLAWLWWLGEVPHVTWVLSLAYLPVVVVALAVGVWVRERVPRAAFRRGVLLLCLLSALVLLVRSLTG